MAIFRFSDYPFYRNPWAEFERLRREMEMWPTRSPGQDTGGRSARVFPPLNVTEDKDHFQVKAELPGCRAESLEITMEGDTLTIKGEKRVPENAGATAYHRREIATGTFSRALTLPTRIDAAGVYARSENGILTVTLPKAEEVKAKHITVHAV